MNFSHRWLNLIRGTTLKHPVLLMHRPHTDVILNGNCYLPSPLREVARVAANNGYYFFPIGSTLNCAFSLDTMLSLGVMANKNPPPPLHSYYKCSKQTKVIRYKSYSGVSLCFIVHCFLKLRIQTTTHQEGGKLLSFHFSCCEQLKK